MKTRTLFKLALTVLILLWTAANGAAQGEILTNALIVEMTRAGVPKEIVLQKISSSAGNYDVSATGLIELKKAGVDDAVMTALMEVFSKSSKQNQNPAAAAPLPAPTVDRDKTAAQLLREARTIYLTKNSHYPALSDLESSLFKRQRWNKFNLTVTRNGEEADLICEINHEFMTHYAIRIYDQKTGKVIAASGVTSLGGSLAGNIANKIIKRFNEVLANETR